MSAVVFLSLPDLKSLCCVALKLQDDYDEPRTKQMSMCRELALLFTEVLAAPALDSFTEITAVMTVQFFQSGVLQGFIHRHCLQMKSLEQVYPGTLQACLSFSLISRLTPNWNKVGLYLVKGRDFLTDRGRLTAVSLELSTSDGKLSMSLSPNTVRLNPVALEDLFLSPLVLRRFCSDPDSVLDPHHTGGPVWCHVLPSMKKGQIVSVARKPPKDGPFKSYGELRRHWNRLYGYVLPDQEEERVVYCSVYFKPVGQTLFTYPLCCVRLAPVQCCPRVDLEGALSSFMADVRETLPSVCGFPTKISTKSSFTTTTFCHASNQSSAPLNLTNSSSFRPVLTHLPPPPPTPTLARLMKPFLGSQPAPGPPLFSSSGSFFSQPSSFNPSPDFSDLFKPASSLNTFFNIFESKPFPLSPPPPLPEARPKFFPIFRCAPPSCLVNVAALQTKERAVERRALPTTWQNPARAPAFLPTFSSQKVKRGPTFGPKREIKPPPLVTPRAKDRDGRKRSKAVVKFNLEGTETAAPKPAGRSRKAHDALKKKCVLGVVTEEKTTEEKTTHNLQDEFKKKSALNVVTEKKTTQSIKREARARAAREVRVEEVRVEEVRVEEVRVEEMARSNQLSRVSSVKMLQWLRARGLNVQHKLPKDLLMLKVMACLAEN